MTQTPRAPKPGDRVTCPDWPPGTVHTVAEIRDGPDGQMAIFDAGGAWAVARLVPAGQGYGSC